MLDAPDGRHRWELRSATPAGGVVVHESVRVDDGERTIRLYDDHAVVSRSFRSGLERLLDPAWLLTHDLEAVSEGEVNGRPTVTARAIRRLSRSPSGSPTDMAPERRIVIDMEDGFLHSDNAVIDDEPYETMELLDLHLGVPIDAGSFTLQLRPDLRVLDGTSTRQGRRTLRWPLRWIGFSRYGWPTLDPASTQVVGSESGTPPF